MKCSIVASIGAGPWAQITRGRLLLGIEDPRHVAARAVEMRLDDLQRKARRNGGIEGVAAPLQDRMPTADAIQWVVVTTPNVPWISGRVVKSSTGILGSSDMGLGPSRGVPMCRP